jgi:hypothetical protein
MMGARVGISRCIANPYSARKNWWDMERFSAAMFCSIGRYLVLTKELFVNLDYTHIAAGTLVRPKKLNLDVPLSGDMIIEAIRLLCASIGMTVSVKCADKIFALGEKGCTVKEFADALEQLNETITWEMEEKMFMFIPTSRSDRYGKEQAFGESVAQKFPSSSFDIKEAGNCFASASYTASVFHLMRVLESGLTAFAKLFPNVPTNKENWQQIIEKIESEIRSLPQASIKPPDWKEKQEQYSQVANNFMFFKDAWRNYTAHARGKYTEDEADSIYRNVRSFMQGLAKMGLQE